MYKIKVKGSYLTGDKMKFNTTYSDANVYHIKEIKWDFGDGTISNEIEGKHVYETAGKKRVKCIINGYLKMKEDIRIRRKEREGITLRVVNNSNDVNNIDVVIFQKNTATFDETAVAWRLITLGSGENEEILYENVLEVAYQDIFNNISNRIDVITGTQYIAKEGNKIEMNGSATSHNEVEIFNGLSTGNINGLVYRSDLLLFELDNIEMNQKGIFQARPTIWIGVVNGVTQGQIIDSGIISSVNTEISLLGIKSADIVVTGGGVGPSALPFSFFLSNIIYT